MKIKKNILEKIKTYPKFYQDVWLITATIPKGETRSYSWVAEKIGKPKASRAVGNALNKNPFVGIIPCHRVIKKDGTIGGFAKGKNKKIKLLKDEGFLL
jgi:methylated-DNA-[protein]-cysteine S-methyltransferase